jgi:hypothetical protein
MRPGLTPAARTHNPVRHRASWRRASDGSRAAGHGRSVARQPLSSVDPSTGTSGRRRAERVLSPEAPLQDDDVAPSLPRRERRHRGEATLRRNRSPTPPTTARRRCGWRRGPRPRRRRRRGRGSPHPHVGPPGRRRCRRGWRRRRPSPGRDPRRGALPAAGDGHEVVRGGARAGGRAALAPHLPRPGGVGGQPAADLQLQLEAAAPHDGGRLEAALEQRAPGAHPVVVRPSLSSATPSNVTPRTRSARAVTAAGSVPPPRRRRG